MISAPSNSTRLRLMAGFGLVVALSAAVGLRLHPIQIGSPVAPAEPAAVTSVRAAPALDLSAQARDDWRLTRVGIASRHAVDRHEDVVQP